MTRQPRQPRQEPVRPAPVDNQRHSVGAAPSQRAWAVLVAAVLAACGGATGGSGGGAYPGGALGAACVVEGQGGCGWDSGHAVAERCTGGQWALTQACAAGGTCTIDGSGAAVCLNGAGGADAGAGGVGPGDGGAGDAAGGGADTAGPPGGDGGGAVTPPALAGVGAFVAAVDGVQVSIDYHGAAAAAQLVHRQSADASGGCVTKAELALARADGSCRLVLSFALSFAGKPLQLLKAQFVVRDALVPGATSPPPCAGWPGDAGGGALIYEAVAPQASAAFAAIPQPAAAGVKATLPNQTVIFVAPQPLLMKAGNRQFTLPLVGLGVAGTLVSVGDPAANCGSQGKPLPQWQLKDINPGSPGYNTTYGLDAFAGKKVVVALVSDWCNSCLAQAELMQKLQVKAVAEGHSDVQLVLIADKAKNNPANLIKKVKTIPVFQDVAGVDAWLKMNQAHTGKFKGSAIRNSGYGYSKVGEEIMYFAPSGTGSLNLTAFQNAVLQVIQAPDE